MGVEALVLGALLNIQQCKPEIKFSSAAVSKELLNASLRSRAFNVSSFDVQYGYAEDLAPIPDQDDAPLEPNTICVEVSYQRSLPKDSHLGVGDVRIYDAPPLHDVYFAIDTNFDGVLEPLSPLTDPIKRFIHAVVQSHYHATCQQEEAYTPTQGKPLESSVRNRD